MHHRSILSAVALLALTGYLRAERPLPIAAAPVEIPGTRGKFDFIEVDQLRHRLLAGHPGNGTLDVIEIPSGKLLASVPTGSAQDAAIDEKEGRYLVSIGKQQKLVIVDAATLGITGEVPLDGPGDIVTYATNSRRCFVGHDDGHEFWVVDPAVRKVIGSIPTGFGPEALVYDGKADRVYANVKGDDTVLMIDPAVPKTVAVWPTTPAAGPRGIALDTAGQRIFVVGANGKLVAMDLASGKVTATADVAQRVDQIAYDPGLQRVYCASGLGVLSVVDASEGKLRTLGDVPTHKGAHSVSVDHSTHDVWIAWTADDKGYIQPLR